MENACKMNQHECPCTKPGGCPNHGKCCDCVALHKSMGNLPICLRNLEAK